jgi:hypothetical protein
MIKSIKNSIVILSVVCATSLVADNDRYKSGYTYFSAYTTNMNYKSTYTSSGGVNLNAGDKVKTDATSTNPVYATGGLYPINSTFSFSTEVSTTVIPQRADETLKVNATTTETNYADMLSNNIQGLVHYKFSKEHRLVFGANYNLSSWKRYKFIQNSVNLNLGVTEQRSISLAAQAGYWYEGYMDDLHITAKAIAGIPVYVHTENTDSDASFDNLGGYNADLYLSVGYKIYNENELGVLAGYSIIQRDGANSGIVHLPENTTTNTYLGIYVAF